MQGEKKTIMKTLLATFNIIHNIEHRPHSATLQIVKWSRSLSLNHFPSTILCRTSVYSTRVMVYNRHRHAFRVFYRLLFHKFIAACYTLYSMHTTSPPNDVIGVRVHTIYKDTKQIHCFYWTGTRFTSYCIAQHSTKQNNQRVNVAENENWEAEAEAEKQIHGYL